MQLLNTQFMKYVTLAFVLLTFNTAHANLLLKANEADALLNQKYQQLKKSLSKKQAMDITKAQRAWIKYRDKTCHFEAIHFPKEEKWTENAAIENDSLSCVVRISKHRAMELDLYFQILQGKKEKTSLFNIKQAPEKKPVSSTRMIGVYEGEYPPGVRHSFNHHPEGYVSIDVKHNPDIKSYILILTSYEPVNWAITLEKGAKIEKVYLSGYHDSRVTGIKGVPVVRKQLGTSYRAPNQKLKKQIKALTGETLDDQQGSYRGSHFEIY